LDPAAAAKSQSRTEITAFILQTNCYEAFGFQSIGEHA